MLIYFDFKNLIRVEIDALRCVIAMILFQLVALVTGVEQTQ